MGITADLEHQDIRLSEDIPSYSTFQSMGIRLELLKGIYNCGFEKPSLIQQKAIRPIIEGRDVIAQAQSGTGKTGAFSIGALQNVSPELRKVQVLILSPTRELANQIHRVVSSLADYLPIRCIACCGGRSNVGQMAQELSKGAHVLVGTPGRILDLLRQGSLRLDSLKSFVLDEADEMLNRGLREQLEEIYRRLPLCDGLHVSSSAQNAQVIIVSATMPTENLELVHRFTRNPVQILVPRDELSLSGLSQFYIDVGSEEWKFEALTDLFASVCVPQTVVFVNTKRKTEWLCNQLRGECFAVAAAHGDLDQAERDSVMERFRSGESRVLVSSDIWARGIDVQNVGLVVNYDVPQTPSDYLHRIGRSGRFGRRGLAVTFVAGSEDQKNLVNIARFYQAVITPAPSNLEHMLIDTDASSSAQSKIPVEVLSKGPDATLTTCVKNKLKKKKKKRQKRRVNKLMVAKT